MELIKENLDLFFVSLLIPILIIAFVNILKKWKNLPSSAGSDYVTALMIFNIFILYNSEMFKELIIPIFKDLFSHLYTILIILELFIILFCISVEKKLQEIYNSSSLNNLILENQLDVALELKRYDLIALTLHFLAWFFVIILIGINILLYLG